MKRFDKFLYGFILGIIFPVVFLYFYINHYYPLDLSFIDAISQLFPSKLLGKLLLLSVMPNLGLVYVFYRSETYRFASGLLISAMPFFIGCIYML